MSQEIISRMVISGEHPKCKEMADMVKEAKHIEVVNRADSVLIVIPRSEYVSVLEEIDYWQATANITN